MIDAKKIVWYYYNVGHKNKTRGSVFIFMLFLSEQICIRDNDLSER